MDGQAKIIFKYFLDDSISKINLPTATSFGDIRSAWANRTGLIAEDHIFYDLDGKELPQEGSLSTILPLGAFECSIVVLPCLSMKINFRGLPALQTSARVSPISLVQDILCGVRDSLGVGERPMRLCYKAEALKLDRSLDEQKVPMDANLTVDLLFTIDIKIVAPLDFESQEFDDDDSDDDDDIEEEPEVIVYEDLCVDCAGSDPISCLLYDELRILEHRVLLDGRVIDSSKIIIEVLPPDFALSNSDFSLTVEHAIPIVIQRQGVEEVRFEEVVVFPSEVVNGLIRKPTERIFFDGMEVDPCFKFIDIDTRCGSLFIAVETMTVTVEDSQGLIHIVHVPRSATVEELRLMMNEIEKDGDFVMTRGDDTLLDGARRLSDYGFDDGTEVHLRKNERLRVEASTQTPTQKVPASTNTAQRRRVPASTTAGPTQAPAGSQGPNLADELEALRRDRDRLLAELKKKEEETRGLQSQLEEAEREAHELRSRIAAGAGGAAVLPVTLWSQQQDKKQRQQQQQQQQHAGACSRVEPWSQSVETKLADTGISSHDPGTGQGHGICSLESPETATPLTGSRTQQHQQQHLQPRKVQVDLKINDWIHAGKEIDLSLHLPSPVTNGAVCAAIAEKLNLSPSTVKMRRWEAQTKNSGLKVVDTSDEGGGISFSDETGKIWDGTELIGKRVCYLTDDREAFFLPRQRRSILSISKR